MSQPKFRTDSLGDGAGTANGAVGAMAGIAGIGVMAGIAGIGVIGIMAGIAGIGVIGVMAGIAGIGVIGAMAGIAGMAELHVHVAEKTDAVCEVETEQESQPALQQTRYPFVSDELLRSWHSKPMSQP